MKAHENKGTALITGASGGIGENLAKLFARDGHDLVLVARSRAKLDALAADLASRHTVRVTVIDADLSDPAAPAAIARRIETEGPSIDFLVNNAGFGQLGAFAEADLARQMEMIRLNVSALTELTGRLLPAMIRRKRGRILNVASTAAFQPGPFMSVYYATKAFVLSFSEGLAHELRGSGVTVTTLCPGPTRTGFADAAAMKSSRLFSAGLAIMDSATVAATGYRAMMRGSAISIPGLVNKALVASVRVTPRALIRMITGALNSPVKTA